MSPRAHSTCCPRCAAECRAWSPNHTVFGRHPTRFASLALTNTHTHTHTPSAVAPPSRRRDAAHGAEPDRRPQGAGHSVRGGPVRGRCPGSNTLPCCTHHPASPSIPHASPIPVPATQSLTTLCVARHDDNPFPQTRHGSAWPPACSSPTSPTQASLLTHKRVLRSIASCSLS